MGADEIKKTDADPKNHSKNCSEQLIDHNTLRNKIKRWDG